MRKQKTKINVYVNYEYWFFSYKNKFKMKPNLEEWYQELIETYSVEKIMFFGNFGLHAMAKELSRLEKITDSIVNTANREIDKDKYDTDALILDSLYSQAAKRKGPNVFVLFVGEGHFETVIQYLKEQGKQVLIYGVKKCFSEKLKSCSSFYVEMPRRMQEQQYYYDLIFKYFKNIPLEGAGRVCNIVKSVAKNSKIREKKIKAAFDELVENGYIIKEGEERQCYSLHVNWYESIKDSLCREI